MGEAGKEPTSRIDAKGNATFTGIVTAGTIRADRIEGLEVVTDQLQALSVAYGTLIEKKQQSTPQGEASAESVLSSPVLVEGLRSVTKLGVIEIEQATITFDLTAQGKVVAQGGLEVIGETVFKGKTLFEKVAIFAEEVIFKGKTKFETAPTFNKSTAGFARIRKGETFVEGKFAKEYEKTPVVQATLQYASDDRDAGAADRIENQWQFLQRKYVYAITDVTERGFTIILDKPAEEDILFSWMALSVDDPETLENIIAEDGDEAQALLEAESMDEPASADPQEMDPSAVQFLIEESSEAQNSPVSSL